MLALPKSEISIGSQTRQSRFDPESSRCSPSLRDDKAQFAALVKRLWYIGVTHIGRGKIVASRDVESAVQTEEVGPDFSYPLYGKKAEPILAKHSKLRYQLLPYTYPVAYQSYQTGAPYMRALFMDFPGDPNAANIPDEYMYGPAFLVAPVTEQGATRRMVYLPAGCDWYNYWTNGGQTIEGGSSDRYSAAVCSGGKHCANGIRSAERTAAADNCVDPRLPWGKWKFHGLSG